MNVLQKTKIVPPQTEGAKKDISHTVTTTDLNDAQKLFFIARNRLLDINHWSDICGAGSAEFSLTNQNGDLLNRTAEKGNFIKISIPGPGNASGEGHDWVYIEAVEDKSDATGPLETIALRVRPAKKPTDKGENISHFFTDDATSSFIVMRENNEITAAVYGRNEKPNTTTDNIKDKLRNAAVATSAVLGLANIQWNNLVKGLIAMEL
jgi:hypothetical protein